MKEKTKKEETQFEKFARFNVNLLEIHDYLSPEKQELYCGGFGHLMMIEFQVSGTLSAEQARKRTLFIQEQQLSKKIKS